MKSAVHCSIVSVGLRELFCFVFIYGKEKRSVRENERVREKKNPKTKNPKTKNPKKTLSLSLSHLVTVCPLVFSLSKIS